MPPELVTCASCGHSLPPDEVIVIVHGRREVDVIGHRPNSQPIGWDNAGGQMAFGMDGTYTSMFGQAQAWVSHLADGTTRRYVAAQHAEWREGENVCRWCRDARLDAKETGRGRISS